MRTRVNKTVGRSGQGLPALLLAALVVLVIGAASPTSALGASAGQLFAFGLNNFGQLGSATNSGTEKPNPTPTLVTLPGATGPVMAAAASENHSLALTSTGQLFAFGLNNFGQLGSATNSGTEKPNPTPTQVSLPGATGPVTQISAGGVHSLVLTTTGQLYAFGLNHAGQLGSMTNVGTTEPNPTPTQVSLPGATGPVTQISAGGVHSLALTTAGQLYAFGANMSGQLGSATNNKAYVPNPTPTQVTLPGTTGPATQISAGESHSLVLTSTDQLYGFGDNDYGELGIVAPGEYYEPNPTPTLIGLEAGRVAPGSTTYHTLVMVPSVVMNGNGSADDQTMASPKAKLAAPVISELRQSHRRWRENGRVARVSSHGPPQPRGRRVPVATTFTFRLNRQARVRFVFARWKDGGFREKAAVGFAGHSDVNQFRFSGSVSPQRRLKPGHYKMIATARSGVQRSKPRSIRFAIAAE